MRGGFSNLTLPVMARHNIAARQRVRNRRHSYELGNSLGELSVCSLSVCYSIAPSSNCSTVAT